MIAQWCYYGVQIPTIAFYINLFIIGVKIFMVESYKYKSKIATAIGFLATIIVSLGKDGLTKIIPAEYVWIIPVLVTIASWILAQKTEDKRVDVAEQMVHEEYSQTIPETTEDDDVDPTIEDDEIIIDDEIVGDEDGA